MCSTNLHSLTSPRSMSGLYRPPHLRSMWKLKVYSFAQGLVAPNNSTIGYMTIIICQFFVVNVTSVMILFDVPLASPLRWDCASSPASPPAQSCTGPAIPAARVLAPDLSDFQLQHPHVPTKKANHRRSVHLLWILSEWVGG